MTLDDLRTLLDFHYWALSRVLDAAGALTQDQFRKDTGSSFKSVRDTLAHMYSAEWTWYQRWQGTPPTEPLPFDQFPDIASLREAWAAHESKMRAFLESLGEAGITRLVDYKMFNGEPASSVFSEMLQHLVNHGSYHRGQLTTLLRQLGASPPKSMDLIAFYRERAAASNPSSRLNRNP